jgi:Protein of unknown function (DUF3108)
MAAAAPRRLRRLAAGSLLVGVTLVHGCLGLEVVQSRLGEGAADQAPKALSVAFVKELAPTVPPVAVAPVPPQAAVAVAAAPAASAAEADVAAEAPSQEPPPPEPEPPAEPPPAPASAVAEAPAPAASLAEPVVAAASAASAPAAVVAATAASAPVAAAVQFDWPPSTRLGYRMVGNYRGPLHGTAQVEWLREGERYQVRLEVSVPMLITRRMLSDGVVGPQGLTPRRYDEETDPTLGEIRRSTIRFEPTRVLLANNKVEPAQAGMQDAASQFVQMTWLFLTRPELLKLGQTVEFPLALPRRLGRWTYQVSEQVKVQLPFGEIDTFHLQPLPGSRKANELSVEMWIAPSLQYLPVRIVLRQDAETHLELTLENRPLQAAPPPGL